MGTLVANLRPLSDVPFKWCPGHVPYLPYPIYATVHSNLIRKKQNQVYLPMLYDISITYYVSSY
jgi:hypothetical protein